MCLCVEETYMHCCGQQYSNYLEKGQRIKAKTKDHFTDQKVHSIFCRT